MEQNRFCYEVSLERVTSLSKSVDSSFSVRTANASEETKLHSMMERMLATDDTSEDVEDSDLETIEPSVIVDSSSFATTTPALRKSLVEAMESLSDDHSNDLTRNNIFRALLRMKAPKEKSSYPVLDHGSRVCFLQQMTLKHRLRRLFSVNTEVWNRKHLHKRLAFATARLRTAEK